MPSANSSSSIWRRTASEIGGSFSERDPKSIRWYVASCASSA
jgi:hypothetical protein